MFCSLAYHVAGCLSTSANGDAVDARIAYGIDALLEARSLALLRDPGALLALFLGALLRFVLAALIRLRIGALLCEFLRKIPTLFDGRVDAQRSDRADTAIRAGAVGATRRRTVSLARKGGPLVATRLPQAARCDHLSLLAAVAA